VRGVVDTVSDEHHLHAARFQLTHGGDLVLREQSSADVIDANFGGNAGCGAGVVHARAARTVVTIVPRCLSIAFSLSRSWSPPF